MGLVADAGSGAPLTAPTIGVGRDPALVGLRERVQAGRRGARVGRADLVPAAARHQAPARDAGAGVVGVVEVREAEVVAQLVGHDPLGRHVAGGVVAGAHELAEHRAAVAVDDRAVELGRRVVQPALVAPDAVAAGVERAAVRRLVARDDDRDVQLGGAQHAVAVLVEGLVVDVRVGRRDRVDAELGLVRVGEVVLEVRVVVGQLEPADHAVVRDAARLGRRGQRELPEAVRPCSSRRRSWSARRSRRPTGPRWCRGWAGWRTTPGCTRPGWAPVPDPGARSTLVRLLAVRATTVARTSRAAAGASALPTSREDATGRPAGSTLTTYRQTPSASFVTAYPPLVS